MFLLSTAFLSSMGRRESVGGCQGICVLAIGRLRVELWTIPKGEKIPRHRHPNVSSRFIFMDRNLSVNRAGSILHRAIPLLRWYHVPANAEHWAEADNGIARFVNIEWWKGSGAPKGAAEDFVK